MRGKRSKAYRKLMQQYALTFNFREPYQILIDDLMVRDTYRFKIDLPTSLSRTLHGMIKPMITSCSVRKLFAIPTTSASTSSSTEPPTETISSADKAALLSISRTFTLRRCNHVEPLSTLACHSDVIDPKSSGTNKHRYAIAVQDESTRQWARTVPGIPSIYIKRSVVIMEPMTHNSIAIRDGAEKVKLRGGVKKRKREEGDGGGTMEKESADQEENKKKRKIRGPKEPNPLSVKRKKTKNEKQISEGLAAVQAVGKTKGDIQSSDGVLARDTDNVGTKRKRKRKHKGHGDHDEDEDAEGGAGSGATNGDTQIEV